MILLACMNEVVSQSSSNACHFMDICLQSPVLTQTSLENKSLQTETKEINKKDMHGTSIPSKNQIILRSPINQPMSMRDVKHSLFHLQK